MDMPPKVQYKKTVVLSVWRVAAIPIALISLVFFIKSVVKMCQFYLAEDLASTDISTLSEGDWVHGTMQACVVEYVEEFGFGTYNRYSLEVVGRNGCYEYTIPFQGESYLRLRIKNEKEIKILNAAPLCVSEEENFAAGEGLAGLFARFQPMEYRGYIRMVGSASRLWCKRTGISGQQVLPYTIVCVSAWDLERQVLGALVGIVAAFFLWVRSSDAIVRTNRELYRLPREEILRERAEWEREKRTEEAAEKAAREEVERQMAERKAAREAVREAASEASREAASEAGAMAQKPGESAALKDTAGLKDTAALEDIVDNT